MANIGKRLIYTITLWERHFDAPETYPSERLDQEQFQSWCTMRRLEENFKDRPDGMVYHQTAVALLDQHRILEGLTPEEYAEYRRTKDFPYAVEDQGTWYADRRCLKDAKETQRSSKLLQQDYEEDPR